MIFGPRKQRVVQMTFPKIPKTDAAPDEDRNIFEGPELAAAYAEVAKDLITHAALTIGGVYAACQIIKRICK